MLEIKTIVSGNTGLFDDKVNEAIREGWQLNKRDADLHSGVFYAELEREVIYEHERDCDNCLHRDLEGGEPCASCDPKTNDKWEPTAGAIAMVYLEER